MLGHTHIRASPHQYREFQKLDKQFAHHTHNEPHFNSIIIIYLVTPFSHLKLIPIYYPSTHAQLIPFNQSTFYSNL